MSSAITPAASGSTPLKSPAAPDAAEAAKKVAQNIPKQESPSDGDADDAVKVSSSSAGVASQQAAPKATVTPKEPTSVAQSPKGDLEVA